MESTKGFCVIEINIQTLLLILGYIVSLAFSFGVAHVRINNLQSRIENLENEKASIQMVNQIKDQFNTWFQALQRGQDSIHDEIHELINLIMKNKN